MRTCINCNIKISSGSKSGLCIKCSRAKFGVWNKGLKETRPEVIEKMAFAKRGKVPPNKGKNMEIEQKIKLSCSIQKINIEDFDGLKTEESRVLRNKFAELGLSQKCFELSLFKCDCCGLDGVNLNAHHKNSWKFFPELRFELTNLVSLCSSCHKNFHNIYGNGKDVANTEEQYENFKKNISNHLIKKTVILVTGVSGSGKSWVCNQIKNKLYLPFDKIDKKNIRSIIYNLDVPEIVYDPTVHVSSFIRRNKDIFNIRLLVIDEAEEVIKDRLISRGGNFTENISKRIKRMRQIKNAAEFSGTSKEVLEYLIKN